MNTAYSNFLKIEGNEFCSKEHLKQPFLESRTFLSFQYIFIVKILKLPHERNRNPLHKQIEVF